MTRKNFEPFPLDMIEDQFMNFLYSRGGTLQPKSKFELKFDVKTRYAVQGDKGSETSGVYCLHTDGYPAGYARNFRTDEYCEWSFDLSELKGFASGRKLYEQAQSEDFKAYAKQVRHDRELREQQESAAALQEVKQAWATAPDLVGCTHEYLVKKFVGNYGLKVFKNQLMIPLKNFNGELTSIQFIQPDGTKRFFPGADAGGSFFAINLKRAEVDEHAVILVCEGYATGATLHELTGCPVICAMNCGNLVKITPEILSKFKGRKIFAMCDNDVKTKGNPGVTAGQKAVMLGMDGFFAPEFKVGDKGSDWNDYANLYGRDVARTVLNDWIESMFLPEEQRGGYIKSCNLARLGVELDERIEIPPSVNIAGMFPKGYLSVIFASPGSGKTFLMQKLACDLSLGGSILNGFYVEDQPRKCVIFEGEARAVMLIKRARMTHWPLNSQLVKIYDRDQALKKQGVIYDLDRAEGVQNVELTLLRDKPDIVFFDSLMSFYTADESKSDIMNMTLRNLSQLAERLNIAVVCTHHRRKTAIKDRSKSVTQDEAIGSTMLQRHAAVMISIEELQGGANDQLEPDDNKIQIVKTAKTWDKKIAPFSYRIREDESGRLDMEIDLNPLRSERGNARGKLWDFIEQNYALNVWFKSSDLKAPGVTARYVRDCLAKFVEEGKLKMRGERKGTEYSRRGFYDADNSSGAENTAEFEF